jgi:hypothetical protein
MIQSLPGVLPAYLLNNAKSTVSNLPFRTMINSPTGDPFYDPWKVNNNFIGTPWEEILKTLPTNIGCARIIILSPTKCYQAHSDIDDRYHLTIAGEQSYLIDLKSKVLHHITNDGIWYEMDGGILHSASNMGRIDRIQLVVQKLLKRNILIDPISVQITSCDISLDSARFLFDQTVSAWLNYANKCGILNNFKFDASTASFNIESNYLINLKDLLVKGLVLKIIK